MKKLLFATVVVLSLAACTTAGARLSDNERLEIHRTHAGEPVRSFHDFGNLYSWTALGDSALTVWTRPNQAYLLELGGRCQDLDFAQTIGFSGQGGTVFAGMDNVIVLGRDQQNIPCRIMQIRPLDVKAVKDGERSARDSGKAGAGQTQSPSGGT